MMGNMRESHEGEAKMEISNEVTGVQNFACQIERQICCHQDLAVLKDTVKGIRFW
jgi:hypothetical protein